MGTKIHLAALSVLLICTFGWVSDALAWGTASHINYDMPNETLSGYAQTWRDPTDFDYWYCAYWGADLDTGSLLCLSTIYQFTYGYAEAAVASPDGPYGQTSAIDYSNAVASYSIPVTTADFGTWTSQGSHYLVQDIYDMECWSFFLCLPEILVAEYWFVVGTSGAYGVVCVPDESAMDNAVIGAINTNYWPYGEPWERGVGGLCPPGPGGGIAFGNWNDSFAQFYPLGARSDDPCASSQGPPGVDRALGAHAHPYFQNATEYHRGHGCRGDTSFPSQYDLNNLNVTNQDFSIDDRVAFTAAGNKPMYLRVPNATTIKRITKRRQTSVVILP